MKIHHLWVILCLLFQKTSGQWIDLSNPALGTITQVQFTSSTTGYLVNFGDSVQGLLKTTNGGYSWTKVLDHPPGPFNWIYGFAFYNDSVGFARARNIGFRTLDGGASWSTTGMSSAPSNNVRIFSITNSYGGGNDLLRSIDSLRNWFVISSIPLHTFESNAYNLVFIDSTTIIATGGAESSLGKQWTGTVECYRSTNAGLSWETALVDTFSPVFATSFATSTIGYTFSRLPSNSYTHQVSYRTTNGGQIWSPLPTTIDSVGMEVADSYFRNPIDGMLCGNPGAATTTDGGLTWRRMQFLTGTLTDMFWLDSLHGWIAGYGGKLYKTDTGPLPIQLAYFSGQVTGERRVLLEWITLSEITNYGFEIQRKSDTSSAFATLPNSFIPGHGTTNEPHHYSFTDSTVSGGVLWYRLKQIDSNGTFHFSDPVRVPVPTSVPETPVMDEFRLEQNYPNPFNPSTQLNYDLPHAGNVSLVVYDVLGRKAVDLANGYREAGNHSVTWNAADLASGVYFLRFEVTTLKGELVYTKVKKLVLMK